MKFDLYQEKVLVDQFHSFRWRMGDGYCLRLCGVSLHAGIQGGKVYVAVDPIYQPFFELAISAGQVIFTLHFWGARSLTVILMSVYPYIWMGTGTEISLEDEDADRSESYGAVQGQPARGRGAPRRPEISRGGAVFGRGQSDRDRGKRRANPLEWLRQTFRRKK